MTGSTTSSAPAPNGIVVANPGSLQEMTKLAAGLAERGLLREFVLPISFPAEDALPSTLRRLPVRLRTKAEEHRRRRQLPPAIQPNRVHHSAAFWEYLAVGAARVRRLQPMADALMSLRNRHLGRDLAGRLRTGDRALVSTYGISLDSFKRARELGIPSYLHYPIAHHGFSEAILREEALKQPEYAGTLQFHRFGAAARARMEAEIASADYVLTLSQFQKRTFTEAGVPESKLVVTPLGVDLELFRPQCRRADGPFRILFVGQVTQRKGISYLVEAFEGLALADSELLFVGSVWGTARPWRDRPGIRHIPHVSRWRLPNVYREADVYVLPSLVEGFPLTAIEAMASGVPVIVSDNTFGADVVTDGVDGFVIPIRDSEALADRLKFLYQHPAERERMGQAGRRRAQDFSWRHYVDAVLGALNRLD